MDSHLEKKNPIQLEGYETPQTIRDKLPLIYDGVKAGVPLRGACAMAGVSYEDFRLVVENVQSVRDGVSAAHAELTRRHLENIAMRSAPKDLKLRRTVSNKDGEIIVDIYQDMHIPADWRASAWILERTSRDDFAPTITTNVNVNGNLDITAMMRGAIAQLTQQGATIVGIQDAEFTDLSDEPDTDEQKEQKEVKRYY